MDSSVVNVPLAEKIRPNSLDEFIGQKHIVGENLLLRRAIKTNSLGSCIFYGPPGTGKTTLARIIASTMNGIFKSLNAVSSGVGDAKIIIENAKKDKLMYGSQTFLLLDECHRWSKAQSDCVLGAIEDGTIIFIGSTTENPYTSMTRAIVSRCKIFEFKPLEISDIIDGLNRAIKVGLADSNVYVDNDAMFHFAHCSGGDLRSAINSLELAVKTTDRDSNGHIHINITIAEQSTQNKAICVSEDMYYDLLSAFCKSIRGSDSDAAVYYMQRLVLAGIDPKIIARRLMAHCSEDIGMADSNALLLASAALNSVKELGYPECMLNLTHAVIYACEAEKSNSVVVAMNLAGEDAKNNNDDNIPYYLLNHPSINDKLKIKYKYPHDFGGYCKQIYLPKRLEKKEYYMPLKNGKEKKLVKKKFNAN